MTFEELENHIYDKEVKNTVNNLFMTAIKRKTEKLKEEDIATTKDILELQHAFLEYRSGNYDRDTIIPQDVINLANKL